MSEYYYYVRKRFAAQPVKCISTIPRSKGQYVLLYSKFDEQYPIHPNRTLPKVVGIVEGEIEGIDGGVPYDSEICCNISEEEYATECRSMSRSEPKRRRKAEADHAHIRKADA